MSIPCSVGGRVGAEMDSNPGHDLLFFENLLQTWCHTYPAMLAGKCVSNLGLCLLDQSCFVLSCN